MEGQRCSNLNEKLNKVSTEEPECTIYKVHRHLREVNPNAYEPEIIAIGPYHRGKDDLKMMEDHKLRYFNLLLQRIDKNVDNFVSTIAPLESKARRSYADPISLETTEFIEMLILDGCFIIEFLLKYYEPYSGRRNDPIFDLPWIMNRLVRDLILFENQIPFFVLSELYEFIIKVPKKDHRLTNHLQRNFNAMYPFMWPESGRDVFWDDTKHLLDLMYRTWCPEPGSIWPEERIPFIESASSLKEANVEFQCKEEVKNLFEFEFRNGTILMAPLTFEDVTESLFRNLIVYEQYFDDPFDNSPRYMSDYVHLLNCFINSSNDIEVLHRNGIIKSWLGDQEVVANMINQLGISIDDPEDRFSYTQIFNELNKHCRKRRNRWMAKLRRNYLNSPWAVISIIVATILLLLTVTQTVFSIMQGV